MKQSILKFTGVFLILSATLLGSCSKNECKDIWPEGFEYYETDGSSKTAICSAPILKGWDNQTPSNVESKYYMELTPQQGVADIYVYSDETNQFQSGDSFSGTTNNGVKISSMEVSANVQYDANGSQIYWSATAASINISSFDSSTLLISCELTYTLKNNNGDSPVSYEMILTDYTLPFNPH